MVKPTDDRSLSSVAPFLKKCYEMVDDESADSIISWSRSGHNSFVIWDMTQFSVRLLPKYFKHSNVSSFIRQLNIYGFRKVDTDHWEFANDGFVRGQRHLLKTIARRKNIQGGDQRKSTHKQENMKDLPKNVEKSGLWTEVENLKTDKNAMMQELFKLRQHQETADVKLSRLKDRFQGMEESQQQMLSFLVMVMQNPKLLLQMLQPKESTWRMAEAGSIVEEVREEGGSPTSDLPLVMYQPPSDGSLNPVESPVRVLGDSQEQGGSVLSDGLKDFMRNEDMTYFVEENQLPLIIPDLYDDGAWEKLLLLSPSRKKTEKVKERSGKDATMKIETEENMGVESDKSGMLELILQEMEKSDDFEFELEHLDPEESRNLELLTEQMELLASNEQR